jgi:short-subunit dehydrogenase
MMALESLRSGVAVITGATGTLGRELAGELAQRGFHLVPLGRNRSALDALCAVWIEAGAGSVTPVAHDFADPATSEALTRKVREACGHRRISLFIHCAASDSGSSNATEAERDVEINFRAPSRLAAQALDDMNLAGMGQIILLSSNLALFSRPTGSAYGKSKAALEDLADSLRERRATPKVHVLVVVPGLIDSPLLRTGLARRPAWQRRLFRPRRPASDLALLMLRQGVGRSGLIVLDARHRLVRVLATVVKPFFGAR